MNKKAYDPGNCAICQIELRKGLWVPSIEARICPRENWQRCEDWSLAR